MSSKNLTYETAYKRISNQRGKIYVIEALWDGDSSGWFLCFFMYEKQFFKKSRHYLGTISLTEEMLEHGLYEQISKEAYKIIDKLKENFKFEFFFPSPDQPDNDCPQWDERHLAIKCADCNKLIIPSDNAHLPKHICYNCHLDQKNRDDFVRDEELHYCTLYLLFGDEEECEHYCSGSIEYQKITKILCKIYSNTIEEISSMGVIKKTPNEFGEIISELETELDHKLLSYSKPELKDEEPFTPRLETVSYKGKEYVFEMFWCDDSRKIASKISLYNKLISAKSDNKNMFVVTNKGLTDRGDKILRFIRNSEAPANLQMIFDEYEKLTPLEELEKTINKLIRQDYLIKDGDLLKLSFKGKSCR